MSEDEESVDLTPGVVWAESQLAVLRQLARHDAELRAENARLREVVRRVEGLVTFYDRHEYSTLNVDDLRDILSASTPAEPSTDTGPAPAGAHGGVQGAGDGV